MLFAIFHEINCSIYVNRPAYLFTKVLSNTATLSQTKNKITGLSAVTVMIGEDI